MIGRRKPNFFRVWWLQHRFRELIADSTASSQTQKEPEHRFRLFDWSNNLQVRAAGFLAAWSRIVVRTLLGTCEKVNGSMEYEARPFERERMAVA